MRDGVGKRTRTSEDSGASKVSRHDAAPAPGKSTLTGALQQRTTSSPTAAPLAPADAREIASSGVASGGQPLPHLDRIQASFGAHDVGGTTAHVGGAAADTSRELGARAFATGDHVGFAASPDLHLAAHEAAHVVQLCVLPLNTSNSCEFE
jgi:hypothetical protein